MKTREELLRAWKLIGQIEQGIKVLRACAWAAGDDAGASTCSTLANRCRIAKGIVHPGPEEPSP